MKSLSKIIKKQEHSKVISFYKQRVKESFKETASDNLVFHSDLMKNLDLIEYHPSLFINDKQSYKIALSFIVEILKKYTNFTKEDINRYLKSAYVKGYEVRKEARNRHYELSDFTKNRYLPFLEKIIYQVKKTIDDLTKNDTEVSRETLSNDEVIQALNNSISKFIELHYQQPQELKHILIDYTETPLKDYIEVTRNAINHSEDIKLLDRIFQTYKRDEQHRIYNYDLFAFLYYAYSLKISFEHLYNSELLKLLGVYTFKTGRDKPVLKGNKIELLQQHKKAVELTQYKENIYLHNLIDFIKEVNTKHNNNLYLLSLLVNISHNLKLSREFMKSLTCKNSFKNYIYKSLPQPINTLLLPPSQIAN